MKFKQLLKNKTFNNLLFLGIAQVLYNLFIGLSTIVAARRLGPDNFGTVTFVATTITYLGLVVSSGLDQYGVREIAKNQVNRKNLISRIVAIKLCISLPLIVLTLIATYFIDNLVLNLLLRIHLVVLIINSFNMTWIIQGYEKMNLLSISKLIEGGFYFILVFFLLKDHHQIAIIPTGLLTGAFLSNLYLFFLLKKKHGLSLDLSFGFNKIKHLFSKYYTASWGIALSSFFIMIYYSVDILYLKFIKGAHEVGIYSASVKISSIIISGLIVVNQAVYPRFSSYIGELKWGIILKYFKKWMIFIAVSGVLFSTAMFIFSKQIILIIYGDKYIDSVISLQILSAAVLFVFGDAILSPFLYALNKTKEHMIGVGAGAVISIVLNPFFISWGGYIGSSVVRLISEASIFGMLLFYSLKEIRKIELLQNEKL